MFHRRFRMVGMMMRLVMSLLLVTGAYLVFQLGWSQGWQAARLAAVDGAVIAPAAPGATWLLVALVAVLAINVIGMITRLARRRHFKHMRHMHGQGLSPEERRERWMQFRQKHARSWYGKEQDGQTGPETQSTPAAAS